MNHSKTSLRHASLDDLAELQELFVGTISAICKDDYTPNQINVWTSSIENKKRWTDKLTTQYFLVATMANKMVGFASLENNNYIDLMYVHKDHQKQGIAEKLYSELEKEAIIRKATLLIADVSKTARGFFEKQGFKAVKHQTITLKNVEITNYKMTKIVCF